VVPFTGLSDPSGVAVDAAGNVYVADSGNNRVVKLAPESGAQQVVGFTGLNMPYDMAVDSAGNVYTVDKNDRVVELVAGRSTQRVMSFTRRDSPNGVAVDSTGNVYVTEYFQWSGGEVGGGVEHPASSGVHRPRSTWQGGGRLHR
jgi:DNA-binding beta-propeller fold protein YncE